MPTTPSTAAAPRFVPTLTEVVDRAAPESGVPPAPAPAAAPSGLHADKGRAPPHLPPEIAEALQEQITQRVLARVDAVLAGRLSDAIALVVLEQTRFMLPRLREEIAGSVRNAVSAALAQERDALQPQPGRGPA
jgi:hypothetical protein